MIRSPFLLAVAVALLLAPAAPAEFSWLPWKSKADDSIAWIDDPTEALAAAAQTGKPILAYVTTTNCGFCRKMEKETWNQPSIERLVATRFVPLRLHADTNPEEVKALGVRAFPTTVLITPQGKAFAGKPGFLEPLELTELLRPALEKQAAAKPTTTVR